ncbi:hypothetical protein QR680_011752 [Steinernema hermaphroditum]|uniref:Peptidase S1 domain-containing protein n=1 Tax=Steinernema hermaphroditum TaxID=289476 RepID=A0AA39I294_9BILA|nr:hypothetical protein QR680_011752 [Steinernema hermaphroditum]
MWLTLFTLVAVAATSSASHLNTSELIYGSQLVDGSEFPFQLFVRLQIGSSIAMCGATLLSPRYALTAAHCVDEHDPSYTMVFAGIHNLEKLFPPGSQMAFAKRFIIHPEFNQASFKHNDIALIELDREMKETDTVKFIKIDALWLLPELPGANGVILGFGVNGWNGEASLQLHSAHVKIVDFNICTERWKNSEYEIPIMLGTVCTDSTHSGFLKGDNGGPLLYQRFNAQTKKNEWRQLGIASIGQSVKGDLPNVYTRVPSFCTWITQNTNPPVACH